MTFASIPVRGSHRSRREESGTAREQTLVHKPVMLHESILALDLQNGDVVVDATFGKGGHSAAIKHAAKVKLLSIDADPAAGEGVIEGNFGDIKKIVHHEGTKEVNKVLFDLGWNMTQLSSGRGFSFLVDEPLNMSYGTKPRSGFTAAEILNTWKESTIADVLYGYGEERYARRIAGAIVARRERTPFVSTFELVEIIRDSVPAVYRHGRLNPATRTFQALRIAVNDELKALEQGLEGAWDIVASGGRVVVITFHSIEDRIVKRAFAALVKKGEGTLLSKKPLTPSATETASNPAARSAKLRAIRKLAEEDKQKKI